MIFKLFVAVMAMSDVGSISTHSMSTDFMVEDACMQVAASFGKPETQPDGHYVFYGEHRSHMFNHEVIIKTTATCRADAPVGVTVAPGSVPPPVMGMLRGFLEGMDQMR